MLLRPSLLWLCLGLGLGGCLVPSPAERVTDAARELNLAARFGRMDVALTRTTRAGRDRFLSQRSTWGRTLRVVDLELVGLEFKEGGKRAQVEVDVAWVRNDETVLRSTRLVQTWNSEEGGWRLALEQRKSGDLGLLGETMPPPSAPPEDVHFTTRTLRPQPISERDP